MYQRKTQDTWEVQGNYGYGDGWETLCAECSYRDAVTNRNLYRSNAPEGTYRIKLVRVKINEEQS